MFERSITSLIASANKVRAIRLRDLLGYPVAPFSFASKPLSALNETVFFERAFYRESVDTAHVKVVKNRFGKKPFFYQDSSQDSINLGCAIQALSSYNLKMFALRRKHALSTLRCHAHPVDRKSGSK